MTIGSYSSMRLLRRAMVIINFLNVYFISTVILFTTKKIVDLQLSREFLASVVKLPLNPAFQYFTVLVLYAILAQCIHIWKIDENKNGRYIFGVIELISCFLISGLIYLGYNGLFLLVFCDCLIHARNNSHVPFMIGILVIGYLVSSYDVFSAFFQMPNLTAYLEVYDAGTKSLLSFGLSIGSTLNIVLFIAFIVSYLADQIQQKENIEKELSMVQNVNRELRDYAAITEKIGENNERKRLAREIHDTLGHALTGIAAGVDACIAMIDRNPAATKKQLLVISKVVRQGIGDVRNSLNKLRPGALEEKGLRGAIENMIEEFANVSNLNVILDARVDNIDIEKTKEDILFRIIQESITNSLRHGNATEVKISLYELDNELCLDIQDNGSGCKEIHKGFGLTQMKERVAIINGTVSFNGDNGFLTCVRIPIQKGELNGQSNHS
ncbi:MAG: sensor histidine kinase [Solobacterium sp.]|nr:sensor histidine kinase [Solobacterium sp.]